LKILHFADLHVGVENYGHIDPQTGLSTRLGDFLRSLDAIVDYAESNRIDAVVFAGDLYKSRDPSQTHQREVAKRLWRLSQARIPAFLLVGNHDLPNAAGRATAVDIYSTLRVPHVYVGSRLQTYTIPTGEGPLQILAVPWPKKTGGRGLSMDEARQETERQIAERIAELAGALDPGIPTIIAGHVTVYGATVGSERSMMMGQDHVLLTSALDWPGIEYVALGHIHKHQVLRAGPEVVYAGSIERVDFSEEDDPKGFCVLSLEAGSPGLCEFHPLPARRFVTVDVEVPEGDMNPNIHVLGALGDGDTRDAVVRLRVKMPAEAAPHFDEAMIRRALTGNGAHYVAGINVEITGNARQARLSSEAADGLQPMQALRLYLESQGKSPEWTTTVIQRAEALAQEVKE